MYWDINKTLSYNCLFNFIVGNRGGGKTYGAKERAIKNFIRTGKQFAYVRRYKEEFNKIDTFFNDIRDKFPNHELEVDGMEFYINGKLAGYAMPLSTAKILKSSSFPLIDMIIFDEFIIEKGVYHYLPDEVVCFLELYETIARKRDVKAFFLSNAITISNPYFIYFDITMPYGGKLISRKDDILIELVQDEEFIAEKKRTRFGRLIEGTTYAGYSIENKFYLDNKNFVAKKGAGARYSYTFYYMDKAYGVYNDFMEGLIYVSADIDPSCPLVYSTTMADHTPNTLLLKGTRIPMFKRLIEQYNQGHVRFESVQIKNAVQEVIKIAQ